MSYIGFVCNWYEKVFRFIFLVIRFIIFMIEVFVGSRCIFVVDDEEFVCFVV